MEFVFALSLIFGTLGLALGILNTLRGWHHKSVINRSAALDIQNFTTVARALNEIGSRLDLHEQNIKAEIERNNRNADGVSETFKTWREHILDLHEQIERAHRRITNKANDIYPRLNTLELARERDAERISELKRRLDGYRDTLNHNVDEDNRVEGEIIAALERHEELLSLQNQVNLAAVSRETVQEGSIEKLCKDVNTLTDELNERTGSLARTTPTKNEMDAAIDALSARVAGIQGSGLQERAGTARTLQGPGVLYADQLPPGVVLMRQGDQIVYDPNDPAFGNDWKIPPGVNGAAPGGIQGSGFTVGHGGLGALSKKHCSSSSSYWEYCPDCRALNEPPTILTTTSDDVGSGDNQSVQG